MPPLFNRFASFLKFRILKETWSRKSSEIGSFEIAENIAIISLGFSKFLIEKYRLGFEANCLFGTVVKVFFKTKVL